MPLASYNGEFAQHVSNAPHAATAGGHLQADIMCLSSLELYI